MKVIQSILAALVLGTAAIGYGASQAGNDMMMQGGMNMGDKSAGKTHHGSGVVQGVDAAAGTVTVKHGAIASAGWPAMTMSFPVQDKKALENVKPGQKVDFAFTQQGSKNVITSIK